MSGEHDWLDYAQKLGPALSALASTLASVTALVVAFRGAKKARGEQAGQITAWFAGAEMQVSRKNDGNEYVNVTINNASNQMVYDLIAQVVTVRQSPDRVARPAEKHLNAEYGLRLGPFRPAEERCLSDTLARACIDDWVSSWHFKMPRAGSGSGPRRARSSRSRSGLPISMV